MSSVFKTINFNFVKVFQVFGLLQDCMRIYHEFTILFKL